MASKKQQLQALLAENEGLGARIAGQALSKADVNRMVNERCVYVVTGAAMLADGCSGSSMGAGMHTRGQCWKVQHVYECRQLCEGGW